jgi:hypothetical protein
MKTYTIFKPWYDKMSALRKEFPDNKLIKHLISSLWGYLTQYNKRYMTFDEMVDEHISVTNDYTRRDCDYFHIDIKYADKCVLVDCKQPFKHPKLARLKCFVLARARYNAANIALLHIDNVIRIHTDCIVFNKTLMML